MDPFRPIVSKQHVSTACRFLTLRLRFLSKMKSAHTTEEDGKEENTLISSDRKLIPWSAFTRKMFKQGRMNRRWLDASEHGNKPARCWLYFGTIASSKFMSIEKRDNGG